LRLRGYVASRDGMRVARAEASGDAADAEALGAELAAVLIGLGAGEILAALENA